MARSVLLSTHPWSDLTLQELAQRASEWGFAGLELGCVGDHLEVQPAHSDESYCQQKLEMLNGLELLIPVLSNPSVGQAIGDTLTPFHQRLLPDYVWGDGDPEGVRERAVEEMLATVRVAQTLGVDTVTTLSGSPLAGFLSTPLSQSELEEAMEIVVHRWQPVFDLCRSSGSRLAFEVQPGQSTHDLASAELFQRSLNDQEEIGFTFNAANLFWQGLDPVEFLQSFSSRIFHVRIQDVSLNLNGQRSLLCGHLPESDSRRGWEPRCPGHGGVDWENVIRALNTIDYQGPFSIEWADAGMDRDFGAEEALRFVQRLDFEPAQNFHDDQPFHEA